MRPRQKFTTAALATTAAFLATACAYVAAQHEPQDAGSAHPHVDWDYRASGLFDELRSHLPPELQGAMGLKPFVWERITCFGHQCLVRAVSSLG